MRETTPAITVPAALAASTTEIFGPEWTAALPGLTARQCDLWGLRPSGAPMHGLVSLVVPVRRADGSAAMLKMQPVDEETEGEPIALAAWAGDGAVRLVDHDPATGAMLLEPLSPGRDLSRVEITEALTVIGGLLARLTARPAPAGLRGLGAVTLDLAERAETIVAARPLPDRDRALLAHLAARAREIAAEPGDRLLHWDLHYENVLAPLPGTGREPWLAIDPKPLAGDPAFDLEPALDNRWEEAVATGDARRETRRRFDLLTEVAGLERDRARAWTLVRVLQECVWAVDDGADRLPPVHVAIAEALGR
ncbi:aminoglycoside phosphotransferase family protein [Nocardiopsis aegyptia]|uniref:Streptomycin 6-kinase n=1 Tax=Nocardiopsis aegyptia TaxID=220378 RepID=A0A7Z0EHV0_9ACTN|nr:aminoglycoside phosphotransferase family protein [Nocardiopsis aegyptia]NYJ32184.1 streptomycin 6-kinase [Nocardiopsis aegyptia]